MQWRLNLLLKIQGSETKLAKVGSSAAAWPYYIVKFAVDRVGCVELGQNQSPDAPLESDPPGYPLLLSLIRIIKKLATRVDNENKQSNIKLAIINRITPTTANSVLFNIVRLYTVLQSKAFNFT